MKVEVEFLRSNTLKFRYYLQIVGNVPTAIGVEEALVEESQLFVCLIRIVQQVVLVCSEGRQLVLDKVFL